MDIAANLAIIKQQISAICRQCGRDPASVRLVAIAKTKPVEAVIQALTAGQRLIGESYVQELAAKVEAIKLPAEWHFVGHLQSNKVKQLCAKVDLIHSVDRISLAEEIDRQWAELEPPANILIQVNLGHEASKSGTTAAELEHLVRTIATLPHLRIHGLMTLPPYCADAEDVRPYFRQLRELAGQIDRLGLPDVAMNELSMGMSHDFQVAIEEGATLIRIGTAIFGER